MKFLRNSCSYTVNMVEVLLTVMIIIVSYAEAANILFVMPFSAMSHFIFLRPIGLELAHRGHNVTVITTHLEKNPLPNYKQVRITQKQIWELIGNETPTIFDMADLSAEEFHHKVVWPGGIAFTELILNSPEVKDFLKKDNTFDLVICEQFVQEALYALSVKYNAPLAIISTFGNCMRHNIMTRNPLQLATVIAEYLNINNPGSFWGRLRNLYFTVYEYLWWRYFYLGKQEELVKKYLPELIDNVGKTPSLYDLQKDASIMLINSHFSFDTPAALLPNIVEIGGVHITPTNKRLPEDLQNLLDGSENGVVYMSFGSNIRSVDLPEQKKEAFINVFRQLKQTVVWKWEDVNLENKPDNLVIGKWLPQQEIIAHPNIKLFITHGGLIGIQEAVYNGVPIVGVPIFCDQYNNVLLAEQTGVGKVLQYNDINEETLNRTLNEVLNNESYMKKAKELQQRWKDRLMSPLDTSIFWLEYVIRNKGAEHMKNPARNMSWFAYSMLDVYTLVFAVLIVIIVACVKLIFAFTSFKISSSKFKATDRKKMS